MTLISSKDSALDFVMKFSPSVCVAVVASLTSEVALQSFVYHAHGTNSVVIHGHEKTLNQQTMHARSGSTLDDNKRLLLSQQLHGLYRSNYDAHLERRATSA